MRKMWSVALVLAGAFLFAPGARAQFTTVTATVTDPNNIPYAGAVMNAVLVPGSSGGYTLSGQPYSGRIGPVTLDSTGSFTVNFGDVTLITPGSPQWQITISSAAATIALPLGTGPQQFTFTSTGTTISGSSPVSLTTALNALAPKLTNFASGGSGTISCSISAAVLFETAPNTAGCATGFTFSTPNLTIPTNGIYRINGVNFVNPGPVAGNNSLGIGPRTIPNLSTGVNDVAVGPDALTGVTTGSADTGIGDGAMAIAGATASNDTAVGTDALENATGNNNTAVGQGALATQTSATQNTGIGTAAGGNTTAGSNTFLGYLAGQNDTSGASNIIIGSGTNSAITTGSNNIVIMTGATPSIGITTSNQIDLGEVIVATGTNVPATSTTTVEGNLTVTGTCTGCGGSPAFSAITNGTNTAAAMVLGTGSSLTTSGTGTIATTTQFTDSANGAASTPAFTASGTPFTGGTGTTTVPLIYFNTTGATAPTTWSTNGTFLGSNAPSGFAGNLLDFRVNGGGNLFSVSSGGNITAGGNISGNALSAAAGQTIAWSARSAFSSPADGVIRMNNNATTSFTRLDIGPDTTSFPAICPSGTTFQVMVAGACTTFAPLQASTYATGTNCSSSASPAVCGSAAAGSVVIAATASTVTVNTTAVTANSQILLTSDDSLGTKLSVTCNSTVATIVGGLAVTARTAGTSFQITSGVTPTVNPLCISYSIVN